MEYCPLQVMQQLGVTVSNILTKIGNGESLNIKEKSVIKSRFMSNFAKAIRFFFCTLIVNAYNNLLIP